MPMNTKEWHSHSRCRESIFNGIIYCANCGGAMCSSGSEYKGEREKYWYLSCINIPKRSRNHCENGARICYSDLIEIVKSELNELIKLSDTEIEQIVKNILEKTGSTNVYKNVTDNKKAIEKRLKAIDEIVIKLYGDNASGIISDDLLKTMVLKLSTEADDLKCQLTTIEIEKSTDINIVNDYQRFFSLAKQYTHIDVLTEEIVRTFIDRIEISKKELHDDYQIAGKNVSCKQKIIIYYRFIGSLQI